jgi:adenylate cyclase
MKDFFELQDEITHKIMVELQVKVQGEEDAYRWFSNISLEAWENAVKADALFERFNKSDMARARDLFERAIELDPEYAFAWRMLAWTHFIDAVYGWSQSSAESLKQAVACAKKAEALGEDDPEVHSLWSAIYQMQGDYDKAIAQGQKAVTLSPSNSFGNINLSQIMLFNCRFEEAALFAERAIRLNPNYPAWYLWVLGPSYRMAGRYDQALAAFEKLLERSLKGEHNPLFAHLYLTDVYMQLGREEEARAHAAQVLSLDPNFSVERWGRTQDYKNPSLLEPVLDNLRKAGLPD